MKPRGDKSLSLSLSFSYILRRDLERRFWTFRAPYVSYKSWFTLVTATMRLEEYEKPIESADSGTEMREFGSRNVETRCRWYIKILHARFISRSYIYIYLINFLKLTINQRASSVRIYLFSNFFNGSTIVFKIFLARYSRVNESRIYSSDSTWAELREWNMVSTINHALLRVC